LKLKCTKFDFCWDSAADPLWGSSERSPRPSSLILLCPTSKGGKEEKKRRKQGKDGKGKTDKKIKYQKRKKRKNRRAHLAIKISGYATGQYWILGFDAYYRRNCTHYIHTE